MVSIDTPFYVGQVQALVMTSPIYDLIVGNIPNVREPSSPNPDWVPTETDRGSTPEAGAVETRRHLRKALGSRHLSYCTVEPLGGHSLFLKNFGRVNWTKKR
ncbi:hypothetical protein HOLleu_04453 [Holothuria leucospilota]|uniref:Uncharacterized protein n=1 Tax=Holothuria leucospilota TaxID=206669 RepID=A0A9Q1CU62_HOLLE|nr:hypothetical protein HOLleu_04453 [Holothuria leucospilota]